jgi:hypothetical protein
VPLPYVSYLGTVSERLEFALGLPQSGVRCKPLDRVFLEAKYFFPVQGEAVLEVAVLDWLRIGALYSRTLEGFHMDDRNQRRLDLGRRRRFFHEMDRVGGGLRLYTSWLDATLGAGYAFRHRFHTGYDARDLDTYREIDGDWYVSLRIQGTL